MQLCDIALCYALFFGMIAYTQKNIHCLLQIFFTYSNNVIDNLGVVVGADGKDGKDGADGAKGDKGADGQDGIPTLGVLLFFLHTLPCRTNCL